MANYVIEADTRGAFANSAGNSGESDTVTVNIGSGFFGAITVNSASADGEIDKTIVNIPTGWSLKVSSQNVIGAENPPLVDASYLVLNDAGIDVGVLNIRSNDIQGVNCFAGGTILETSRGPVAIEALRVGDLVATRDNGLQPIRWIGSRHIGMHTLLAQPKLRPIRIAAGALGGGTPATDLTVSPQHRILVRSAIARRMFGRGEVLVAAKHLLALDGIDLVEDAAGVEYFHMLFDRHEVVFSNGAETESLHTGPQALKALGREAREEILTLFPELAEPEVSREGARLLVKGREGRKLAARHQKNRQPLAA